MSLVDNGNGLSAADIAAVTGNSGNFGFGGDGAWWLLVLFLFAFNGNYGFGNGGNGDMQRSFDQQSVMNGLNGIAGALSSNSMAIMQALNTNQMAAITGMNSIAANLQNCCCENRAGLADLKYTVATENCADRQAVSDGIRDVIASQTANTQAILDKLCQQELDAKNETIAQLRTQLNLANLAASQNAQTGQILADNAAQTATLRQALNPTPIPAYVVQNPSCCNQVYSGCGCGNV